MVGMNERLEKIQIMVVMQPSESPGMETPRLLNHVVVVVVVYCRFLLMICRWMCSNR